jgi:flagellar biosynthesis repressor protein FlbT
MPLKLKLATQERIVVNGAVLLNIGYRTTLVVCNFAHVMREKDVLQEEDANTPTKRLYLQVQAMLMQAPPPPELTGSYRSLLAQLRAAYVKPANLAALDAVDAMVEAGDFYKALIRLKPLIEYEANVLNLDPHQWRRPPREAPLLAEAAAE